MLHRAIGRLPAIGVRSQPLSTNKTYYYWGIASAASQGDVSGPHASSISVRAGSTQQQRTATCGTAPAGLKERSRQQQWQDRRRFSTGGRAMAPAPSPGVAGEEVDEPADGRDSVEEGSLGIEIDSSLARFPPKRPAAAGLRPETAPASTPLDLECKAYYMARNIGIKTVCTVRHVGGLGCRCSTCFSLLLGVFVRLGVRCLTSVCIQQYSPMLHAIIHSQFYACWLMPPTSRWRLLYRLT